MNLTPYQSAVAACVLDAMENKEIARAIGGRTLRSVEDTVSRLRRKLRARNRVALALALADLERGRR